MKKHTLLSLVFLVVIHINLIAGQITDNAASVEHEGIATEKASVWFDAKTQDIQEQLATLTKHDTVQFKVRTMESSRADPIYLAKVQRKLSQLEETAREAVVVGESVETTEPDDSNVDLFNVIHQNVIRRARQLPPAITPIVITVTKKAPVKTKPVSIATKTITIPTVPVATKTIIVSNPFTIDPCSTKVINPQVVAPTPELVKNYSIEELRKLIKKIFNINITDKSVVWTQAQMLALYRTLCTLPRSFSKHLTSFIRENIAYGNKSILGYMLWSINHEIHICAGAFNYGLFEGTVIHEMAHLFTAKTQGLETQWKNAFYYNPTSMYPNPKTSPPTAYGCSNVKEDIAESVKCYWLDGDSMKKKCPDRYEFVRKYIMDSYEYRLAKW